MLKRRSVSLVLCPDVTECGSFPKTVCTVASRMKKIRWRVPGDAHLEKRLGATYLDDATLCVGTAAGAQAADMAATACISVAFAASSFRAFVFGDNVAAALRPRK